ncbi:MAG: vitamin K epoxide reductase family protein [Actinomycetaceae bacterium]|nr:vitamin K epoxide reductase family protein [Arcanobacterium sp.]MDD7505260.1 vitamin K epoxide reductase family protein [Actinomycetaceae bacterium]MDY6144023.1 vitamin K epoxide reductase family protein [Arcanobacterium sp.]
MSNLTEAQIDARLARLRATPSEVQLAGGAERLTAAVILISGIVGTFSSIGLLMAEKQKLSDPDAVLLCDINPLVGCGKWIGTWQNEVLFGVSNSVWGLAFFAGIAALGLALLAKARFASWLWQLLAIGVTLAIAWVLWFQYESFFVEGSLCPYCVLVWVATIPLFVTVWARSLQAHHWGEKASHFGRALVRSRFVIIGAWYFAMIAFTIIVFWDRWVIFF